MQHNYIALLIWGWMGLIAHPFYISLTEIRQNPQSGRLEMAQKVFWDDLEVELNEYTGQTVDILGAEDQEALNQIFSEYLTEKTRLSIKGKDIQTNYLGYEIEEDAIWFYIESEPVGELSELNVECTILFENFDGQQNIVHVYFPGFSAPKSLLLSKGEKNGTLKKE